MAQTQTPAQEEREKRQQQREARESKEQEGRKDAQGNEINMSANIPEEQEGWENVDLDQTAKHNDLGDGHHKNSATFGKVISHYAPDAAGLTPEENHERAERRMGHSEEEQAEKDERDQPRSEEKAQEVEERVQEEDDNDDDSEQKPRSKKK